MEEKIKLLHSVVDSADLEDAQSHYGARNHMEVDGSVDCSIIRKIFGWDISKEATSLRALLETGVENAV